MGIKQIGILVSVLAIAGLLLLVGIPIATFVFKGAQALREQEQSAPAL